jgi:2'-5' RNA ligase
MGGVASSLRTFIAVELPHSVQSAIAAEQARVQAHLRQAGAPACLRWTAPGNIHLTLRVLGETTPAQRAALTQELGQSAPAWPALHLAVGKLGCFPTLRAPRVVWLGVDGELEQLAKMQAEVETLVQAAGFPGEERAFSPHLTVARARREASRTELRQTGQALASYQAIESLARFTVDHVVYFQSELRPGGSLYTPLAIIPCGRS